MDNLELMKQEISNLAKEKKEEFEKVSDYIFAKNDYVFAQNDYDLGFCEIFNSIDAIIRSSQKG